MMVDWRRYSQWAALLALLNCSSSAFMTPSTRLGGFLSQSGSKIPKTVPRSVSGRLETEFLGDEINITPEGYGFTATASRILRESKRDAGYHRASASDSVIDVMQAVTNGEQDVALVFDDEDDDKLLGLFTESDYIRVSLVSIVRCSGMHICFTFSHLLSQVLDDAS